MKAVVWTDAIQGIIYLGGVITVLTLVSRCDLVNKMYKLDIRLLISLFI